MATWLTGCVKPISALRFTDSTAMHRYFIHTVLFILVFLAVNQALELPKFGQDLRNELEATKTRLISQFVKYTEFLDKFSIYQQQTPKTFRDAPIFINCNSGVLPKMKTLCISKAKNAAVKVPGRGLYYISNNLTFTWHQANRWCRSRGFDLVNIENRKKGKEIMDLIADDESVKQTSLWTYGSNFGRGSNGQYLWKNGEAVKLSNSGPAEKFQTCVLLKMDVKSSNLTLHGASCRQSYGFICEVPKECYASVCYGTTSTKKIVTKDVAAKCPDNLFPKKCSINEMYFYSSGNINEELAKGVVITACKKILFLSSQMASPSETYKLCCELGMNVLIMDTQQKLDCMVNEVFSHIPNYTTVFWTDAYTSICSDPKQIFWCSAKKRAKPDIPWLAGEPHCLWGVENTAVLRIMLPAGAAGLQMSNVGPNDARSQALCEQDLQPSGTVAVRNSSPDEIKSALIRAGGGPEKLVVSGRKSQYSTSTIKDIKNVPSCKDSILCKEKKLKIKDPKTSNQGTIIETCGKTYLLSKAKMAYSRAWQFCCNQGMALAAFNTREEMLCIVDGIREDNIPGRMLFVATFDEKTDRDFYWCKMNSSNTEPVQDNFWCADDPGNYQQSEPCGVLIALASGYGCIGDVSCSLAQFVLCEGPPSTPYIPMPQIKRKIATSTTIAPIQSGCPTILNTTTSSTVTSPKGETSPEVTSFKSASSTIPELLTTTTKNSSTVIQNATSLSLQNNTVLEI